VFVAATIAKARPPQRGRRRRIVIVFALVAAALVALDYFAFPYGRPIAGLSANRGENGVWLEYTWYFGRHSAAEEKTLALRLRANQIRYAYFHVRFIKPSGRLHFRYPDEARRLVATLHQEAPGVKILAWVFAGNAQSGQGRVNLADPAVRRQMAAEARWLTTVCGFDGVQWDYELCPDNDSDFLALLRETRAVLPPGGARLSVAAPMWVPPGPLRAFGWSEAYFSRVAALTDDMAVMGYDSALWLPRAYVYLMREQAVRVTRAVAASPNPRCRILIGVPTYEATWSHRPHAESLPFALRGVREGLADPAARPEAFAGIALFADYTTDAAEWRTYRELWLDQ